MPTYVSDAGVLHPAKEIVALTNYGAPFSHPKTKEIVETGSPYIYEGPCRAALFELWLTDKSGNTTTFGINFENSPEFLQALRNLNMKKDEYLAWVGYDVDVNKKAFEKKASKIAKHELPQKVAEIKRLGGGSDHATGKNVRYGGLGDYTNDLNK